MEHSLDADLLTDSDEGDAPIVRDVHTQSHEVPLSLPLGLRFFFGLNGFTLTLETLGLMYVINSRVEMPIPYLTTYGAIAFLPYSFKPLYGYLSQGRIPRSRLFMLLLLGNGISVLSTCLIPKGGVFLACLVAFSRGVTDSWAELCLGLTLIDHARANSQTFGCSYETLASKFQAQAAMSRNSGSFVSNVTTFAIFAGRQLIPSTSNDLSSLDANVLLVTAGSLQILGALAAKIRENDLRPSVSAGFHLVHNQQHIENGRAIEVFSPDEASALREDEGSHASYSSQDRSWSDDSGEQTDFSAIDSRQRRGNGTLVIFFQITVLILAMKRPISEASSHMLWQVLLVSFLLATAIIGLSSCFHRWWQHTHQVGLYLILKHSIPTDSMVVGSFFYSLFQSSPAELQVLSLVGSGMTVLSSWSYGKVLAPYSSGIHFLLVIAGTTVLAAVASLGNIVVFQNSKSHHLIWIVLATKMISGFFGEWAFLPDVVLATKSINNGQTNAIESSSMIPVAENPVAEGGLGSENSRNVAVEYGTLISCIDFGDQLGSLATGPLVALLGISRENNFDRLDHLVLICFVCSLLSLALIILLRKQ